MRKDGSRFLAEVVATAIHNKTGRLSGFAKITRDITARRQAEDVLRASENVFVSLLTRSRIMHCYARYQRIRDQLNAGAGTY